MTNKLLDCIKDLKIDLTKTYFILINGEDYTSNKFNITRKEFLRFAKLDLKQADERGYINSLTNSKRAIDCQIDEALNKVGIKHNSFYSNIEDFLIQFLY